MNKLAKIVNGIDLNKYNPLNKERLDEAVLDAYSILNSKWKSERDDSIPESIEWLEWLINPYLYPSLSIQQRDAIKCAIRKLNERRDQI